MIKNHSLLLLTLFIYILQSFPVYATTHFIFAIDLIRHGDRAPLHDIPRAPYVWKNGLGELTAKGVTQEVQLGSELRKSYVDEYLLLPDIYNPNVLSASSTDTKRARASADAFLLGLYPMRMRPANSAIIPIHTIPNVSIHANPSFAKLWQVKTKHLQAKLAYWSKQTGMPLTDFQQVGQLGDILYIRQLHHIPLPKGISLADSNIIIALGEYGIVNKFKLQNVAYPIGHQFLTIIKKYFTNKMQRKSSLKYILLSGHDSTLMSVMTMLKLPFNHIPPYAAYLHFSLLQDGKKYYVKVSYNNKPMIIPACEKTICPIARFNTIG